MSVIESKGDGRFEVGYWLMSGDKWEYGFFDDYGEAKRFIETIDKPSRWWYLYRSSGGDVIYEDKYH